jgi:hypothetical protein
MRAERDRESRSIQGRGRRIYKAKSEIANEKAKIHLCFGLKIGRIKEP